MIISEITSSIKFENAKTGTPITIQGYHYSSKLLTRINKNKMLWFSDDKESWASPWMKIPPKAYKVIVSFKNPIVFLRSSSEFETDIARNIPKFIKQGYDGVIYTPDAKRASVRQAVYFYPTSKNLVS
jgi:hypothetical protein